MTLSDKSAITRRDFVKTSAALTGGGVAAGLGAGLGAGFVLPAFARTVHNSHTETLKVGLVGCGGRGTGAAQQALSADPNVRITAMADAFVDKIDWSLGELKNNQEHASRIDVDDAGKFTGFDGYKDLIDSGVDVVLLCTPPVFRPMHLAYAVERGKHIFCEKPMAVDAPGVRSVIESANKAAAQNTAVVAGFCWRYSEPMVDVYSRVLGGQIGEVRSIQSTYNTGPLGDVARKPEWSDTEWQLRNWKAFIHLSGDHICEQAVHGIDWMGWAMGDEPPVRAFATGGRIARQGEWTGNMYDHFSVIYEYANGARGYHMCRQIGNCSNDNTAYITGTKGTLDANPWPPTLVIEGEQPYRWRGQRNDMYQTEHDLLFKSIRDGEVINDGARMAKSSLLAILGRDAAYTGQTITWDQMMNSTKSLAPNSWEWGDAEFPDVPVPGRTRFE